MLRFGADLPGVGLGFGVGAGDIELAADKVRSRSKIGP
jgi:hypothetical protein